MPKLPSFTPKILQSSATTITGETLPNREVRVYNRSAAPFGARYESSMETIVRSDAKGRFSAPVKSGRGGDYVEVKSGGSDLVLCRLKGRDTRRPEASLHGLKCHAHRDGITFEYIRKNRSVSEPFATLKFINSKDRSEITVELDAQGHLPKTLALAAKPGDILDVYVSDQGTIPEDAELWTRIAVQGDPEQEPKACAKLRRRRAKMRTPKGYDIQQLQPIDGDDPIQGNLDNCWLIATLSSLAYDQPDALRAAMNVQDGKFKVRFFAYDHTKQRYCPQIIEVSPELYLQRGKPFYGTSRSENFWPMLLEKAYAQWIGGYEAIESEYPHVAFEALLGREASYVDFKVKNRVELIQTLLRSREKHQPTVLVSYPQEQRDFDGTGLEPDHAYSLLAVEQQGAKTWFTLRNPWGDTEPGDDGVDDGIFKMSAKQFFKYFVGATVATV